MAADYMQSRSVDASRFSMIPRPDVPRSAFRVESTHKSTFDAGYLVPIYVDEVLPGDSHRLSMTAFARMATPIFPLMDNLHLDTFFFFVPNRLVWSNWEKFMGEQNNPADSTSYLVPEVWPSAFTYNPNTIYDYMGIPTPMTNLKFNSLPFRAYNMIWNDWFRDQNLQNSVAVPMGDGPDAISDYNLLRRGKRHDYFTSCLPWPQKGNTGVLLPLGTSAPVYGIGYETLSSAAAIAVPQNVWPPIVGGPMDTYAYSYRIGEGFPNARLAIEANSSGVPTGIYADLSQATAATINQLRTSFAIQKLLERDARGGTRYAEILRSHFGVVSPDARLQRPEYLGGGSVAININPVAQTSESGGTPLGQLGGIGTTIAHNHGFSQSFVEHGYIIGLASVRADLTYQQGLQRMWSRRTKHDFYWPAFANLGEQAVLRKEIYATGLAANDDVVFGYQSRWEEYRYHPSRISGLFRSQATLTLDAWHLAQEFSAAPVLNAAFIEENPPMARVLAVGAGAGGQQFLFDSFFQVQKVRPLPAYSVPGLIDHF